MINISTYSHFETSLMFWHQTKCNSITTFSFEGIKSPEKTVSGILIKFNDLTDQEKLNSLSIVPDIQNGQEPCKYTSSDNHYEHS